MLIGLINGCFYALLSLGLAIIFGILNVINFAHGALYMMGAFAAWMLVNYTESAIGPPLLLSPFASGTIGIVIERLHVAASL